MDKAKSVKAPSISPEGGGNPENQSEDYVLLRQMDNCLIINKG